MPSLPSVLRRLSVASVLVLSATLAAPARADLPPMLRDMVVVTDEAVRLGDLFRHLGPVGDKFVAAAPAPGERILFDSSQLAAIAKANGIAWEPQGRSDRVTVERGSRVVDAQQIESRLSRAVADQLPGRDLEIELETRLQPIHLPIGEEHRIRFEDVRIDERGQRAVATLLAPTGDGREHRIALSGRLHPVLSVPVLARPVMPGEQIGEDDLDWVSMRASRLRRGMVTDQRHLVGRTVRRPVTPGAPLNLRDIQDRVVVGKGSLVTVLLRSPHMQLTTRGKALEDGAEGATIRVVNTVSGRSLDATVLGPDLVEVRPAQSLAANLGRSQ